MTRRVHVSSTAFSPVTEGDFYPELPSPVFGLVMLGEERTVTEPPPPVQDRPAAGPAPCRRCRRSFQV